MCTKTSYILESADCCHAHTGYFKRYCKALRGVVQAARKMANDRYIENADNKRKVVWDLIRKVTGSINTSCDGDLRLNSGWSTIENSIKIANTFNRFFAHITHELNLKANYGDMI